MCAFFVEVGFVVDCDVEEEAWHGATRMRADDPATFAHVGCGRLTNSIEARLAVPDKHAAAAQGVVARVGGGARGVEAA